MSTTILDISVAGRKNYHGNSFLARYNRLKREKEGQSISFDDDLSFSELNPYGSNSVVRLWNENYQRLKYFGKHRGRDTKGRFLPLNK